MSDAIPFSAAGVMADPAAAPRKLCETILFYGQSNAGAGGLERSIFTEPLGAPFALNFVTRRQIYGAEPVPAFVLKGVGPAVDSPEGTALQSTATGFALADRLRRSAIDHLHYFLFTVWSGGQPLSAFLKDTGPWQNLLTSLQASRLALDKAGFDSVLRALVFIQGEAGPYGRAVYRQALETLLDDLLPALKKEAAQTISPVVILVQTNKGSNSTIGSSNVEVAQWDVARGRPDCIMAGPSYQAPLIDNIHQSLIGRMVTGDLIALVYDLHIRRNLDFVPLHPASATRDGRFIRLAMNLPPEGQALQWDKDWVPASENYGFVYTDTDNSNAIDSVEIVGPAEILITLRDEPRGKSQTISYAQGQSNVEGWGSARGQLISPTTENSYYHGLGHPVPAFISHYCIRFAIGVDEA